MSLRCARPGAPGAAMPSARPPSGPSWLGLVRWPAVAGAGGVSLFVLLCLTALVWAELYRPRAQAARRSAADFAVKVAAPISLAWEATGSDEPLSEEPPTSFGKSPVSPPLPESPHAELFMRPGLPLSEQPVVGRGMTEGTCGTSLQFARSPAEAARQALDERKLLFTIHLSGHFEDPDFT